MEKYTETLESIGCDIGLFENDPKERSDSNTSY